MQKKPFDFDIFKRQFDQSVKNRFSLDSHIRIAAGTYSMLEAIGEGSLISAIRLMMEPPVGEMAEKVCEYVTDVLEKKQKDIVTALNSVGQLAARMGGHVLQRDFFDKDISKWFDFDDYGYFNINIYPSYISISFNPATEFEQIVDLFKSNGFEIEDERYGRYKIARRRLAKMDIAKELVRIAKTIERTASTGNFSIENRCVVIPDELYENDPGEVAAIKDEVADLDGIFYMGTIEAGYYEAASIDIVEKRYYDISWAISAADDYEWFKNEASLEGNVRRDIEAGIGDDSYLGTSKAMEDTAWAIMKPYVKRVYDMDDNGLDEYNLFRENDAVFYYDSDEPLPKDAVVLDPPDVYDLEDKIAEEWKAIELDRLNEKLDKIADKYGLTEYGVSARFSNGETWYSPIRKPNQTQE